MLNVDVRDAPPPGTVIVLSTDGAPAYEREIEVDVGSVIVASKPEPLNEKDVQLLKRSQLEVIFPSLPNVTTEPSGYVRR